MTTRLLYLVILASFGCASRASTAAPAVGAARRRRRRGHGLPADLRARGAVHVTWRMDKQVWNLRRRRCFGVMQRAMYAGALKGGFRLVHYAVMGNHVHLLVEAPNRVRLVARDAGAGDSDCAGAQSRDGAARARHRRSLSRAYLADAVGGEAGARLLADECASGIMDTSRRMRLCRAPSLRRARGCCARRRRERMTTRARAGRVNNPPPRASERSCVGLGRRSSSRRCRRRRARRIAAAAAAGRCRSAAEVTVGALQSVPDCSSGGSGQPAGIDGQGGRAERRASPATGARSASSRPSSCNGRCTTCG